MATLELLRSGGAGAEAAIALAAALTDAETDDTGGLVHCAAMGHRPFVVAHASNSPEPVQLQALAVAAIVGRTGVVRALCDAKVPVASLLPDGFYPHATALHLAVLHNQWASATELLHYGARLDALADTLCGATAAEWAAFSPDAKTLQPMVAFAVVFYRAVDAILAGDVTKLDAILTDAPEPLARARVEGQPRYVSAPIIAATARCPLMC
jgi:hypothetical protein